MASNGTSFTGSGHTFADDSRNGSSVSGDISARELVHEAFHDPGAALESAGAAVARVEREIDQLWRDSMLADDRATSQRLAEVGHALHRAALLLECDDAIG